MKQIKFISAILLIATMFLGFNACSDDEKDPNNENKLTGSLINKMTFGNYLTADISYKDSKPTGSKIYSPYFPLLHADVTVSYQVNKIVVTSKGDDEEGFGLDGNWTLTYTLENGLVKSCVAKTPWENETVTSSFSYNSEGYLSKIIAKTSASTEVIDFVYNNGNLIKYDYTESDNHKTSYTVTSSNIENKSKFPIELYTIATEIAGGSDLIFNSLYVAYLGVFGKTSANLPQKINWKYYNESENCSFTYKTDENGNITSVKANYDGEAMNFSFSY